MLKFYKESRVSKKRVLFLYEKLLWLYFYKIIIFIYNKKIMLSSSEILYEYSKCVQDPVHTIQTYLETKDLTQGGFVPFKLFPRQKEIVRSYEEHA